MSRLFAILTILMLMHPAPARAGSKRPSDATIIAMAQAFVLEHYNRQPEVHSGIAFDIANIHPQPEEGCWAVIGGFMADSGARQYRPMPMASPYA